jgi:hypothetical protein
MACGFSKNECFLFYLLVFVSLGSRVSVFVREFWSIKAQSICAAKHKQMTRSRSITPEMPAELRADYVAPVNVGAFEDVFGVDGGAGSEDSEGSAAEGPTAPSAAGAPSAGKGISR